MKRIPQLNIGGNCRKNLVSYILVANLVEVVAGIILSFSAVYISISLESKASFLRSYYNSEIVPIVVIMTGLTMTIASVFGVYICFKSKADEDFQDFQKLNRAYFYFFIMSTAVLLSVAATTMVLFQQLQIIHTAFSKGLTDAVKYYRTNSEVKQQLDTLQIKYACCGLISYKDWFEVEWLDRKYLGRDRLNQIKKNAKYFLDDVPFSCCDRILMNPCVSERVLDDKSLYAYEYTTNLTLYKHGCVQVLSHTYGTMMFEKIAFVMIAVLIHQVCIITSSRLLQTAVQSAIAGEDPTVGWIISWSPKTVKTTTARKKKKLRRKLPSVVLEKAEEI